MRFRFSLTFLFLFICLAFFAAPAHAQAPTQIVPTYACIGGIPCTSIVPTIADGVTPTIFSTSPNPTNAAQPTTNPNPGTSVAPCETGQTSIQANRKKHRKHRGGGSNGGNNDSSGFIEKFIQWLMQFLVELFKKLGIDIQLPSTPTPGQPEPTQPNPEQPNPTTANPNPEPTQQPEPSTNPCTPTEQPGQPSPTSGTNPTIGTQPSPSVAQPSAAPTGNSANPQPVGVSGTWKLVFDDEFNGSTLDTSKWGPNWYGESGNMNNATTKAANVSVSGGNLILTLASANSGALVHTDPAQAKPGYLFPVGNYAEARINFPGSGSTIYNWPAWWASATASDGWPSSGEHDIAEGLGTLTVNYHSPSGSHNQGTIPGTWSNAFHTYGIYRQANKADVYWDGKLVKSYTTDDSGKPEILILNVGSGYTGKTGTESQVKVDYVRVWGK